MASDGERENALTAARAIVAARYPDCEVALLVGSAARGQALAASDLDLWIVTQPQRPETAFPESFAAHGWQVEAFATSHLAWQRIMAEEARERMAVWARLVVEGVVLRDRDGLAARIRAEARALADAGPPALTASEVEDRRYALTGLIDDFLGVRSYEEGLTIMARLVTEAADFVLARAGRWSGKGKHLWQELVDHDAAAAQRLSAAMHEFTVYHRKEALVEWVDAALAPAGGRLFEGSARHKEDTPDA